jgi:ABC-2 type transport system permease protein
MKYFGLWLSFFKISLMAEAEFRLNLFIKVLGDIVWYISQLAIFEVLFYHAPQIAGWNIHSMRVFMGVLFLTDCLYMILFHENFEGASSVIRKGELDFILVKPINSQFMFSFRRSNPVYLINMLIVLSYLGWAIWNLEVYPSWWAYPLTLLLVVGGLGVLYSLRFFFAALNVLFVNAYSLTYVWYQFYRLGTRPHALYPAWLRWCVLTIFPVALISSVPATNLVQGLDIWLALGALLISMFLLFLTSRFWEFVLKRYSSASS